MDVVRLRALRARPLQTLHGVRARAVELILPVNQPRRHHQRHGLLIVTRARPCRGVKMAVVIGVAVVHVRVAVGVCQTGSGLFDERQAQVMATGSISVLMAVCWFFSRPRLAVSLSHCARRSFTQSSWLPPPALQPVAAATPSSSSPALSGCASRSE